MGMATARHVISVDAVRSLGWTCNMSEKADASEPVQGVVNATLASPQAAVRGFIVYNLAVQHMRAAELLAKHARAKEAEHHSQPFGPFFEDISAYVRSALLSSAASLETLINELFIAEAGDLRKSLHDFDSAFWGKQGIERLPTMDKYKKAIALLGCEALDDRVVERARVLLGLRNTLIHFKPAWPADSASKVAVARAQLERELRACKFDVSSWGDEGADFITVKCMSASCADWAVATVRDLAADFAAKSNIEAKKLAQLQARP